MGSEEGKRANGAEFFFLTDNNPCLYHCACVLLDTNWRLMKQSSNKKPKRSSNINKRDSISMDVAVCTFLSGIFHSPPLICLSSLLEFISHTFSLIVGANG